MDIRAVQHDAGFRSPRLRGAVVGVLLGALAVLCFLVLRPFISPILWAVILAYVTWPLYRRVRSALVHRTTLAASLMTLLVVAIAIVPLLGLLMLVQHELVAAYRSLAEFLSRGPHSLPAAVRDVPWLGPWLQEGLDRYSRDPASLTREIGAGLQRWGIQLAAFAGNVGRTIGKIVVAVLTLFVLYRDGESLLEQAKRIAMRFLGNRLDRSIAAAGLMTRAVVYGFITAAMGQGVIAGVGYWVFGVEAPVLLGVLTAILSTVPIVGTALVWVPVAVGLAVAGYYWKALLLILWCSLLVHPVDNLLRPILISNVTRVPFLLVMFGVIGGLAAFGLVGVFIGPVLLGIAAAIWNDWAAEHGTSSP